MLRSARLFTVCVAVLIGAAASAQPPKLPPGLPEGIIPEGATIGDYYECPDPEEPVTKPECCRIVLDIDATGTATKADVECTFPPLEASQAACELGRKHEPRITNKGPVPYSRTGYQEHYPAIRNAAEFHAMAPAADAACNKLSDKGVPR